ncbi:nucleotidyltransferase family protein [Alkalicoccus chagannorensis]|uniref:nucleotidyltransferase family protein n=1 Tax=Alkalicoccus chagannorensis TaxID=427072 RepID=UPI00040C17F0|nr:nucleotidyltransferase family protein [Alkalicoccus chagannorensis]
MLRNEADVRRIIEEDTWMMDILRTAARLKLPDGWICAGFVRTKIWDTLHGYRDRTPIADVDVIYFDPTDQSEAIEKAYEAELYALRPDVPRSVKNEARMHEVNDIAPYTSAEDAIARFPETATAIGVKLHDDDQLQLTAPHGVEDLLHLRRRPTPAFQAGTDLYSVYVRRGIEKNWQAKWPHVKNS